MKKIIALVAILAALSACGKTDGNGPERNDGTESESVPQKRIKKILVSSEDGGAGTLLECKYDAKGRVAEYNMMYEGATTVVYNGDNEIIANGRQKTTYKLDQDGYLIRRIHSEGTDNYTYSNGLLAASAGGSYTWTDGNLTCFDCGDGIKTEITYNEHPFKSNINWLFWLGIDDMFREIFLFKGTYPQKLPSSVTMYYQETETLTLLYTFDEDGDIKSLHSGGDRLDFIYE